LVLYTRFYLQGFRNIGLLAFQVPEWLLAQNIVLELKKLLI